MAKKMPPSEDRPAKQDDDVLVIPEGFHDQEDEVTTEDRNRRGLATDTALDPMSLSGSYFHRVEAGEIVWTGIIVGEVQPGVYLCQVDQGLDGADRVKVQVLIPLEQMLSGDPGFEFRFYDTEQDATLAQAAYRISQEQA